MEVNGWRGLLSNFPGDLIWDDGLASDSQIAVHEIQSPPTQPTFESIGDCGQLSVSLDRDQSLDSDMDICEFAFINW